MTQIRVTWQSVRFAESYGRNPSGRYAVSVEGGAAIAGKPSVHNREVGEEHIARLEFHCRQFTAQCQVRR